MSGGEANFPGSSSIHCFYLKTSLMMHKKLLNAKGPGDEGRAYFRTMCRRSCKNFHMDMMVFLTKLAALKTRICIQKMMCGRKFLFVQIRAAQCLKIRFIIRSLIRQWDSANEEMEVLLEELNDRVLDLPDFALKTSLTLLEKGARYGSAILRRGYSRKYSGKLGKSK